MANQVFDILLADDDPDDCMFFQDALDDLAVAAEFNTVKNGVELMNYLKNETTGHFPDVLFLDLNMPCKSGLECLSELKQDETLKQIPVIIYSTSSNPEMMDLLYDRGAQFYIRKPADFANLKSVIYKALCLSTPRKTLQPTRENFMIQP